MKSLCFITWVENLLKTTCLKKFSDGFRRYSKRSMTLNELRESYYKNTCSL